MLNSTIRVAGVDPDSIPEDFEVKDLEP